MKKRYVRSHLPKAAYDETRTIEDVQRKYSKPCPEGGYHVAIPAIMHKGEEKCKKCDILRKNW